MSFPSNDTVYSCIIIYFNKLLYKLFSILFIPLWFIFSVKTIMFAWLVSQPASNAFLVSNQHLPVCHQPAVLFSHNKSAPATTKRTECVYMCAYPSIGRGEQCSRVDQHFQVHILHTLSSLHSPAAFRDAIISSSGGRPSTIGQKHAQICSRKCKMFTTLHLLLSFINWSDYYNRKNTVIS